ncbi:MAG: SH3 domain-containing protein [Pseudomonadota bacterium]
MLRLGYLLAGLALFMMGNGAMFAAAQGEAEPIQRVSHFSGKPVPRFETLRYSAVNGRVGPSLQHPVRWRFERAGLPVLVLKESRDWRWVRDPDGAEVWIHARMLSSNASGIAQTETVVRAHANVEARGVVRLGEGVLVDILDDQDGWLRVEVDGYRGWVPTDDIWGGAAPASAL